MKLEFDTIRDARDQIDLRLARSVTEEEPERYIVFLNGRTEWIEKYDYLLDEFQLPERTGFVTWDHRGQGASGGLRAYVTDYSEYARDAQTIIAKTCGDKPYAIVSHSMGGLIAIYATLNGFIQPQCLVLSSPLLGLPNDPVPRHIARPLATALTWASCGHISSGAGSHTRRSFVDNGLTHDFDLFMKTKESPYKIPGATFAWVAATFRALSTVFNEQHLKKLNIPILIMAGTKETVVDPEAFRFWVRQATLHAKAPVKLRMIPGGKHELFSELPKYRGPTVATARSFLEEHFYV